MKRLTIILAITCLYALGAQAYVRDTATTVSVLSEGKWAKIRVSTTGVYKITYDELKENVKLSNPANVRIYGYGGELIPQNFGKRFICDLPSVAFYMHKGSDGVFNQGDYILFYARGSVGWQYQSNLMRPRYTHTRNHYSDYGYYFITESTGVQTLLSEGEAIDGTNATDVTMFDDYQLHEQDLVNMLDVSSGMAGGGREFYGEDFNQTTLSRSISFNFHAPVSGEAARIYANFVASGSDTTSFTVQMNSKKVKSDIIKALPDNYTQAVSGNLDNTLPMNNNKKQTVQVRYNMPSGLNASGYLNYIELTCKSSLTMDGTDRLAFRTAVNWGDDTPIKYHISGANENVQVWDVTYADSMKLMPTELNDGELTFVGSNEDIVHEYVAVRTNGSSFLTPTVVSTNTAYNQNLHGLKNIEMVIISPDRFRTYADELAELHREIDGISVEVVSDEEVYNEFSSGTPDATAYRRLMKLLYDRRAQGTRPKWLLLFGGGTFDNRKILPNSGDRILLTYQAKNSISEPKAYATDDYFAFMGRDEGESDIGGVMAFAVGRLPARSESEAAIMIRKIREYMTNKKVGTWRNNLLFLADDGDHNQHTQCSDEAAVKIEKRSPNYIVNKIYLDAYQQEVNASGESYPVAKNQFDQLMHDGVLFFDYCGHGSPRGITGEKILLANDVKTMVNDTYAFWMLATCSFSHFDTKEHSIAEHALINENGGAIAVLSADRTVYATQNKILNTHFCDTLFAHTSPFNYYMTIGEATRCAKNKVGGQENKLPYVLLGDPALRLHYPCQYEAVVTSTADTLHALDVDSIMGFIRDENGDSVKSFNGTLYLSVLDKMQEITCPDNDEPDPSRKGIYTYTDYPNTLFNGRARIENGCFATRFMAPKDIRYNYGDGRMVLYAHGLVPDAEGDSVEADASGHYTGFKVGGSTKNWIVDDKGPDLNIYLNNPLFRSGGETYEDPYFYAEIADENGINTSGSSIGHDLTLIVDNDMKKTYNMNSYFTADEGSYKSGVVRYHFSPLSEGSHSLKFRAWDLLNNSSTASLHFQVVKSLRPELYSVTIGPNPVAVGGSVTWHVEYDRQEETTEFTLMVFNYAGQLVWEKTRRDANYIVWDTGTSNVAPGMYLYKLKIKALDTDYSSHEGKIIVY